MNVDHDFEPLYIVPKEKKKLIKELKDALKQAEELILATDEDREGESIGWHLVKLLKPKVPVKRMVFSEITKEAIQQAIKEPRQLDESLVAAQETRRVLDRLYGYRAEPAVVEENPAETFRRPRAIGRRASAWCSANWNGWRSESGTYWDLKAALATAARQSFSADLQSLGGKRVATGKDFDESTGKLKADADVVLLEEEQAREMVARLGPQSASDWTISEIKEREEVRRPYAPFTTSTCNRRRTASSTCRPAKRCRSPSGSTKTATSLTCEPTASICRMKPSPPPESACRTSYGKEYLHPEVRQYTTKSKNAQEAHEAIRPAGTEMKTADELGLSGREAMLYDMIWKRTVATQMAEARLKFRTAIITADDAEFRATGRQVDFPRLLPGLRRSRSTIPTPPAKTARIFCRSSPSTNGSTAKNSTPIGHETKPPARFTEATLVRRAGSRRHRPAQHLRLASSAPFRTGVTSAKSAINSCRRSRRWPSRNCSKSISRTWSTTASRRRWSRSLDDISNGEVERCRTSGISTPAKKDSTCWSRPARRKSTLARPARSG